MRIHINNCPFEISPKLFVLLQETLVGLQVKDAGVSIRFTDPGYSAESGGFHPVEIGVDPTGNLLFITDYAYVGRHPHTELAKCLDFDFQCDRFQTLGLEFPLSEGMDAYAIWEVNFLAYHEIGVYRTTVDPL